MGSMVRNFNIMGIHWKIHVLEGRGDGAWGTSFLGEVALKGRHGQFADLNLVEIPWSNGFIESSYFLILTKTTKNTRYDFHSCVCN